MLKIAVIGNNYGEVSRFIEYKFKGQIESHHKSNQIYTLKNGDTLYSCHDEAGKDRYKSMLYDAILITEYYESLLDVIRGRTTRPVQ